MAASGRIFHKADISSTSIPLRASLVDGEFLVLRAQMSYRQKLDVVATSADVENCLDCNFS